MTPAGALGGQLEHARVARLRREQFQAKIQRVLGRRRRQLVHEAFDHEAIGRVADGAHIANIDADFLARIGQREIRHGVGIVRPHIRSPNRTGSVPSGGEARSDRRAGDVQLPCDQLAARRRIRRSPPRAREAGRCRASCHLRASRSVSPAPPTAFEASTAAGMKSTSRRRPNPPPSRVVWTLTCSGVSPAAAAAALARSVAPGYPRTSRSHRL